MPDLEEFLAAASVDPSVFELRRDYRAMLIAVDGIEPAPADEESNALLAAAEDSVRRLSDQGMPS